ncbi:hypothetical protein PG991_005390 [Apiospora marii]|uniref:DUF7735 domain-containing protein n=1 Tax=Apiospora marii TaxID=335849 RepID=A0ABR1SAU1_9PEZI
MVFFIHGLLAFTTLPYTLARLTPSIPSATALAPSSGAGFLPPRAEVTTGTEEPMPTSTADPYQCALANVTKYFDVITPTGAFSKALISYGSVLIEPCLATATGLDELDCTVSNAEDWCGFSTTAPPAMATSYVSYASAAADFWKSNSASISSVSSECPNWWGRPDVAQHVWLSQFITHAGCYIAAHPSTSTDLPSSTQSGFSSITSSDPKESSTTGSTLPAASAAADTGAATSGAASLGSPLLRHVSRVLAW